MAHIHIHHHFHGLAGGYVGLGAAAMTSWIGLLGAGEAVLVTAGVLAAHGRLDLDEVVLTAWLGAIAGGNVGWLLGLRGGRALISRPGPLYAARQRALARGERFYARYGTVAVFFTPAWVAGIARMRWRRFFPANLLAALVWALALGVGAYFVGPPVLDLVDSIGLGGAILIAVAVLGGALAESLRRRRRRP